LTLLGLIENKIITLKVYSPHYGSDNSNELPHVVSMFENINDGSYVVPTTYLRDNAGLERLEIKTDNKFSGSNL
jgi:hypothetical protein